MQGILAPETAVEQPENEPHELRAAGLSGHWLPFVCLCLFILAHGFGIPVLAIGPSWALWPTLSDLTLALLVGCTLACWRHVCPWTGTQARLCRYLGIAAIACVFSLLLSTALTAFKPESKAVSYGVFQVYRLCEVLLIFWATSHVPLTGSRVAALRFVAGTTLFVACGGIFATFFGFLPPELLTAHLPSELTIAGPWYFYQLGETARGWGTIGYNRGYVAVQVLALLALYLSMRQDKWGLPSLLALGAALGVVFLSGSRAGLAAAGLFVALLGLQRPRLLVFLGILAASVFLMPPQQLPEEIASVLDSQAVLARPIDEESLNGRVVRWDDHLDFLCQHPLLLITGAGFGSIADRMDDGHCLYLHIVLELGILALLAGLLVGVYVLTLLARAETGTRVILPVTLGLLFGALTQETFYPLPTMGRFLDLYACYLALTLRATAGETSDSVAESTD